MKNDIFRPTFEPARTIYDALTTEADKRKDRSYEEWRNAETQAVYMAAVLCAKKFNLIEPKLEQVIEVEADAIGHVDYASKWAYAVARLMEKKS